MKSLTISVTKGFLLGEIMLAFSLMTLFITSAIVLSATMEHLHAEGVEQLENVEYASMSLASSTLRTSRPYGNDTIEYFLDPLTNLQSDYHTSWGRETCDPRLTFDIEKVEIFSNGIDLGSGNISTDIEVRHGIAYLSADSSTAGAGDIYIVNLSNPESPVIISYLNTGPGISAIDVAGPYVYASNLSTTNQLQIIDIRNRSSPIILAKFKLPLPTASTTPPVATSIFYSNGLVYLGTEKWEGNEFSVIDVKNPENPQYLGGFETNTLINSIYVREGIARLAASDVSQMRILDVHNPLVITSIYEFSPSGFETQQGKVFSYFEEYLSFGRTTGGFNIIGNHEVFTFSSTSSMENSHDIAGGVYGLLLRPPYLYLATHSTGHEFQVWKSDLSTKVSELSLGFQPTGMSCDGNMLYFSTGNRNGVATLKMN